MGCYSVSHKQISAACMLATLLPQARRRELLGHQTPSNPLQRYPPESGSAKVVCNFTSTFGIIKSHCPAGKTSVGQIVNRVGDYYLELTETDS